MAFMRRCQWAESNLRTSRIERRVQSELSRIWTLLHVDISDGLLVLLRLFRRPPPAASAPPVGAPDLPGDRPALVDAADFGLERMLALEKVRQPLLNMAREGIAAKIRITGDTPRRDTIAVLDLQQDLWPAIRSRANHPDCEPEPAREVTTWRQPE